MYSSVYFADSCSPAFLGFLAAVLVRFSFVQEAQSYFFKTNTSRARILSGMSSTISCHYEKMKEHRFWVVIKLSSLHQKSLNNIVQYAALYLQPVLLQSWHLRKKTSWEFVNLWKLYRCVNSRTDGLCTQMSARWGELQGEMNIIT